jgi:hypothetical protein
MIDVLTPLANGRIALQSDPEDSDFYSNRAVETFITGGPRFRKGMVVERTEIARRTLRALGMSECVSQRGVYMGKARGKYAGCILVRLGRNRKAEPFAPELWKPVTGSHGKYLCPSPIRKQSVFKGEIIT